MAALPYLRCCIDVKHRPLPSSKHVSVLHYYTCAPSRGIEGHKSFQQQKWSVNNRNSFQLFWWLYLQLCSGIGITTSHLLEISHSLSMTDHRMVCYHQFEHVAHIFWSSVLSQQRQSEKNILVNMTRLVSRLPFFKCLLYVRAIKTYECGCHRWCYQSPCETAGPYHGMCISCIFACCTVRLIVDQFINMLSIFLNIVVIILMSVL